MDDWTSLDETSLPTKDKFYSMLTDSNITDDEYNHAQNVCNIFDVKSLGEYADLYMKVNILLLADVFENFRKLSLREYKLDPAHYYTAPGLTWDAMLRHTGVELDLFIDIDMVMFVERGIRGEISQCSNRYVQANNKYFPQDYDPNKPTKFII